ncbi:MAG: PAS domain-containing protein [Blastocatellia bacterium]
MSFARRLLVFALAYSGRRGDVLLALARAGQYATFWPPAGLTLAMLLSVTPRRWGAVMLAASVSNLVCDVIVHRQPFLISLGFLLVNLIEPLIGAVLIGRLCRPLFSLTRLPHVLLASGIVMGVSTPLGALGGAGLILQVHGGHFQQEWFLWWMKLLGALVLMPLAYGVLTWQAWPQRPAVIESIALLLTLGTATVLLFRLPYALTVSPAVLFLFLMWAALRFGATGVGAGALVMTVAMIWFTNQGRGPFSLQAMPPARLLMVQMLLATGALLFYTLAAVMDERRAAVGKLQTINVQLDQQVQARTAELLSANQKLRESEDHLRYTVELNPQVPWTATPDGQIEGFNERWLQLTGLTYDEARGDGWLRVPHPDDRPAMIAAWTHSIQTGAPYDIEHRIRTADGSYCWMRSRALPRRNEAGEIVRWYGSTEDIHERKVAEEELRRSTTLLQTVISSTPDLVWAKDTAGRITIGNQATYDLLGGGEASKVIGRGAEELIPAPEHARRVQENDARIMATGQAETVEEDFGNPAQPLIFQTIKAPLRDAAGQVVGVVGVSRDITARRQQEEALQERTRQLDLLARTAQLLLVGQRSEAELLEAVFSAVAQAIGAEMYFNYQPSDEHSMRLCNWGGLTEDERMLFATMRYGELLCGRVAVQRQPIIVEDILHNHAEGSEAVRKAGYGAYAGFPLLVGERLLGTIAFITRQKTHFRPGEVQMIQTVCDQVAATLDRLQLTDELRASEERQRLALEGAELGSWDVDWQTGRAVWNRRQAELQGYTPDSGPATLERWRARLHPEDAERVLAAIEHARCTREPLAIEHRLRRADTNEERWLSLYGRFVYDATGAAIRCSGVARDITEHKLANERLRESEARLRLALEASFTIAFTWDIQRDIVRRYHSTDPVLGATDEAQLDTFENVVSCIYAADRDLFRRAVQAALHNAQGRYQAEYRIADPTGRLHWYAERGQVEFAGDGTPLRLVGLSMDITERKQIELEREQLLVREQQARQLAEDANRAKDDWLAMVTHELRSPLNAILGHARLLDLRRAQLAADFLEFVTMVRRNGERQNELINDLLDTARIATGKLRLEPGQVKLAEIVLDALDTVRPSALAKGVILLPDIDAAAGTMWGDAARLRQVAWNLLNNAVKFTPAGGAVVLCLRRQSEQMLLTVSDTGQGIAPDFLPHVFERFSQADTARTRRFGGLGLGLALVKHIVELHGGTIMAASAGPGQGAVFTVTLPVRREESNEQQVKAQQDFPAPATSLPPVTPSLPTFANTTILVIDDEADTRNIVTALLSAEGAQVLTAANAAEAWPLLTGNARPQLLVCDIGLPEESGYSLLARLRQWEREYAQTALPALALTAHDRFTDRLQALQTGFQMHVAKPVDPEELLLVLQSLLTRPVAGVR